MATMQNHTERTLSNSNIPNCFWEDLADNTQIAQRVERRLNILREKNILNYFEDLAEGRKIDFVVMELLKSIAGEEFNLKVAQLINQLMKKYQKAKKKGCPSAQVFATVADKFCNFIEAYKAYYNKHSQEAEEYYKRYNEVERDGSDNLIRKYIYGEDFTDNISSLKNVLSLFSPKSMDLWFDKWFKKEIKKYGTQDVGEMIKSIDEILLMREPNIKPINTSFWKALGEFQNTVESKQEADPTSEKSSASIGSDSVAKNIAINKQEIESTDTDTDDLCETVLANYIDKKCEKTKKDKLQEENDIEIYDDQEKSSESRNNAFVVEEKEEANLENVFIQQIKKLVKRYGIVNIKEGLINLGMEKYLYNLQKDVGNVDCVFFAQESNKKECEEYKKKLLEKRKRKKIQRKLDLDKSHELELSHSAGSTTSFHDKIEKALSDYPWNLKPKKLHKDLKVMVETLETELMNCNLKHYSVPQPILTKVEKAESSTEQILPGWAITKKPNKQTKKIIPLIKKSMEGKMEGNQQKLLKNIVFKLILKDQKDISPTELETVFNKFSEGKNAWGPGWSNYGDRLKQLLTETYQQKVLESALEDYKFQENYLGLQDLERARQRFSKFEYTDIPFAECDMPQSESFSEKTKSVKSDPFMDFNDTKKRGGYLPSLEDLIDRKKKLKEYEKKRIASLSGKKDSDKIKGKKLIDCEKEKHNQMFPEIEDSNRDEPWFKEVYFEERDK